MSYLQRTYLLPIGFIFSLLLITACGSGSNGSSPLEGSWQSSFQQDSLTVDINLELDSSSGIIDGSGTIDGKVETQENGATFTEEFLIENETTGSFDDPDVMVAIQLTGDTFNFEGTLSDNQKELSGTAYLNVENDIVNDAQFPLTFQK